MFRLYHPVLIYIMLSYAALYYIILSHCCSVLYYCFIIFCMILHFTNDYN
uniref:Uncharacterized protein n=1 Tax=Anguilla anguilla TaxID=7936 RepID=A0A0E9RYJ7_ANGAN